MFLFKHNVNALEYGNCDYTTVANLRKLVNENVNLSYSYDYYLSFTIQLVYIARSDIIKSYRRPHRRTATYNH